MYHDGDMFRRRDEEEEVLGVSEEVLGEVQGEEEEEDTEDEDVMSEFGDDGDLAKDEKGWE